MMTGQPVDLNVEQWKREGREQGARAMLVVWDTFPFPPEAHPVFIAPGESIPARFAELDGGQFQHVSQVHFLDH